MTIRATLTTVLTATLTCTTLLVFTPTSDLIAKTQSPPEFIASDEFLEEGAREKIMAGPVGGTDSPGKKNTEPIKLADGSLAAYLRTLKDVPVLNREHEIMAV